MTSDRSREKESFYGGGTPAHLGGLPLAANEGRTSNTVSKNVGMCNLKKKQRRIKETLPKKTGSETRNLDG